MEVLSAFSLPFCFLAKIIDGYEAFCAGHALVFAHYFHIRDGNLHTENIHDVASSFITIIFFRAWPNCPLCASLLCLSFHRVIIFNIMVAVWEKAVKCGPCRMQWWDWSVPLVPLFWHLFRYLLFGFIHSLCHVVGTRLIRTKLIL